MRFGTFIANHDARSPRAAGALAAGAGLLGGLGHIAATEATARAPVSTLAPFDFTGLVWALGFDAALIGALPGAWGLAPRRSPRVFEGPHRRFRP